MSDELYKEPDLMEQKIFLEAKNIVKNYRIGKSSIEVLRGVDFAVERGSWTTLLGASGSGKTTLLNMLGTLERPDSGEILYDGVSYRNRLFRWANKFRNENIGFIFQLYHMLPELTLLQNVMLPGMFGNARRDLKSTALQLLDKVGLSHRLKHRPNELSGGEQQRAAIARALLNSPELILADEPTGNLDSHTGSEILEIFQQLHAEKNGVTIFMITHSDEVAAMADTVFHLKDGVITD
jgi:ABC-type lipoprotein export system ATPase subunit